MARTTNSIKVNGSPYSGGGTYTLELEGNESDTVTRIHFLGRQSGPIQVNAWIVNSDRKELLGTINLDERGTMITEGLALYKLEFVDSGAGPFSVIVKQDGK